MAAPNRAGLERAQEVQQILLLLRGKVVEIVDHSVCLGAETTVLLNGVYQIAGSAIV
jgi:hypothetical protein